MLDLTALADPELMARVAGGDELALGAIYDRHATLVYGTVLRFVRDTHATEEIVQDTFLTAWRRSDRYRADAGSLAGWLLRIARNRAIDRLRAAARRPAVVALSADSVERGERELDRLASDRLGGRYPDGEPETLATRRWAGAVVRTALSAMPEPERRALELAYDEGLTQAEIATTLNWPLGTVKSRTRRALAGLRTALEGVPDLVDAAATPGGAGTPGGVASGGASALPESPHKVTPLQTAAIQADPQAEGTDGAR
jgi:RNA polymerase sigma-70 factor (ECF subfamily)